MKQGYRLKIYSEKAKQQNEADRAAYMKILYLLVRNPDQVLLIDETHKEKMSSRQSRAYGRVGHEVVVDKWFRDGNRCAMIEVADVNDFVQSALGGLYFGAVGKLDIGLPHDTLHMQVWKISMIK
jgi:hypothetical protein